MSRLFACVRPDDGAVAALEELHRKDQRGVRFTTPDTWHVTLRFLGEADPGAVASALARAEFRPTTVELGPAVDVGRPRLLLVPASGADDLAAEAVRVTRHLGDAPVRRRFAGHVTIARMQRGANVPRALGELVHAAWRPSEVELVESRLRPDGARHEVLATFPIAGPIA